MNHWGDATERRSVSVPLALSAGRPKQGFAWKVGRGRDAFHSIGRTLPGANCWTLAMGVTGRPCNSRSKFAMVTHHQQGHPQLVNPDQIRCNGCPIAKINKLEYSNSYPIAEYRVPHYGKLTTIANNSPTEKHCTIITEMLIVSTRRKHRYTASVSACRCLFVSLPLPIAGHQVTCSAQASRYLVMPRIRATSGL